MYTERKANGRADSKLSHLAVDQKGREEEGGRKRGRGREGRNLP